LGSRGGGREKEKIKEGMKGKETWGSIGRGNKKEKK
jgi:hypothetical protein